MSMLPPQTMRRSAIDLQWIPLPSIVAAEFETFALNIRSFREPLERSIRQVLSPSIIQNFEEGGRPPWELLSEITVAHKRYKGARDPSAPLVETGRLKRRAGQVTTVWQVDGPGGEAKFVPTPDIWYGALHQEGYVSANGDDVPARPWAVIQEDDANDIEEIFFEWIEERAARAGLTI